MGENGNKRVGPFCLAKAGRRGEKRRERGVFLLFSFIMMKEAGMNMILVIGEILVDRIGEKKKGALSLTAKRGGAPLNVASDLADLKCESFFYGVIGKDILGRFLLSSLKECSPFLHYSLGERADRETSIAFYRKEDSSFQFIRKQGADFSFSLKERNSLPYQKAKRIHFGSLFLSSPEARKTILSFAGKRKKKGKILSFDVNFRSDIFAKGENFVPYYQERISLCDIVKFTKEEMLMLSKKPDREEARKFYSSSVKRILVTDGEEGSFAFYKGKKFRQPVKKVKPKDTIGAGDSFRAGCLSFLAEKDRDSLTEEDISLRLKRGNGCGRKTCLISGALHAY